MMRQTRGCRYLTTTFSLGSHSGLALTLLFGGHGHHSLPFGLLSHCHLSHSLLLSSLIISKEFNKEFKRGGKPSADALVLHGTCAKLLGVFSLPQQQQRQRPPRLVFWALLHGVGAPPPRLACGYNRPKPVISQPPGHLQPRESLFGEYQAITKNIADFAPLQVAAVPCKRPKHLGDVFLLLHHVFFVLLQGVAVLLQKLDV